MDRIQIISRRVCDKPIFLAFQRLGLWNKDDDRPQDFRDDLIAFNNDAKLCASLATETCKAFTKWRLMVEELHACTEAESGRTATSIQEAEATKTDESVNKVQATSTSVAKKDAESQVKKTEEALKHGAKCLDTVADKNPRALEHLVTTSSTTCTVSAPVPVVIVSVNSAAIITGAQSPSPSASPEQGLNAAVTCSLAATNGTALQLNIATQPVQIAKPTVIVKQDVHNSAVTSQARTVAAMPEIQENLRRLQDQRKTLDDIKAVLHSCTPVLNDLSDQMSKLEQIFTGLSTVINANTMVRAVEFDAALAKAKSLFTANGRLKINDATKETIFTATLQLKAYLTLLQDVSSMHDKVGKPYARKALERLTELSKGAIDGSMAGEMQSRLVEYMGQSGAAVAETVKEKQEEISANVRDRIKWAAQKARKAKEAVRQKALVIDEVAKQAVKAGAGRKC
ncbi:hypothetical protein QBC42DRAFT_254048 [Cladorrhinum samala]|uniref:Uncharacterized protein n=1 Tax=Cladorrhinum samala TaxID=585594 RepID=A0AAV9HFZ3_9PEZI|nr:hypothetical protein QBC42DRAFT_254048 [Cladorrhinum samala]